MGIRDSHQPEDQLEEEVKTEEEQFVVKATSDTAKQGLRSRLADQILAASKRQLKQPVYVVRPPPEAGVPVPARGWGH